MKRCLLFLSVIILFPTILLGQGRTSGSIEGMIVDATGEPLPGANVVAIHEPSGTQYGVASRENGRYSFSNVRVGGPYEVQVTFVGFNPVIKQIEDVELGETVELNFTMEEGAMTLDEISVTAEADPVFNTSRTGAQTNISKEEISRTPTLSRSLRDFTRLTPQATGGGSIGGANDRYNNLLVDGATLNDIFGLGEGTPGSQAGVESPISLDAIEEFNVDIAPFGVTNNNFTGAQVNAITRSGTNTFSGSAYYQLRNEDFIGNYTLEDGATSGDVAEFDEQFFGIRLGGPIVEDQLFFFISAEIKRESAPLNAGIQGSGQANIFPFGQPAFDEISSIAQSQYGYNPGGVSPLSLSQDNNKILAKLDWNINQDHQFSFRYNFVDAVDEEGIERGTFEYSYSNRLYDFNSEQNSFVAELNSSFGSNISNTFRAVYTRIRDSRDVVDEAFPQVEIELPYQGDTRSILMGIDRFSQANSLGQDLIEITDNFTYIKGDHEFTVGSSNQFFFFDNLFVQDDYGSYIFDGIEAFEAGNPSTYRYSYLLPGGSRAAEFSGMQFGVYVQDRWTASQRLTLTGGLRIDVPVLPEEPTANPDVPGTFDEEYPGGDYRTDRVASGNILWSPRLGFNWNASGDGRTTQVRGGIGIFSGPPPFVWISNQYSNTGEDYGRVDVSDDDFAGTPEPSPLDDNFFNPDPNDQPAPGGGSGLPAITTSEINLISEDFKYPQDLKVNMAVDQQLFFGMTGTIEGIYSKAINAVTYKNLNLEQVGETIYGRPLYGEVFENEFFGSASGNPAIISDNFTNALYLENTSKGYSYSITGQLEKQFETGLQFNVSYTYNRAKNVNNGTSSRAISNWTFNESKDINDPELGTSYFERRHRFLANVSYRLDFVDRFTTTISVIFDGHSGTPYSWIYNGNANGDSGDGSFQNDLVYVPASAGDVIMADDSPGTYEDLDNFISDHSSLDDYRGEVVPRATAREPWANFFDLRINQEIRTVGTQRIEISASMFNVLNFLNNDWGKREFVNFNTYPIWTIVDYDEATGKPIISFNPENAEAENRYQTDDISSRWQLQVGLRYSF